MFTSLVRRFSWWRKQEVVQGAYVVSWTTYDKSTNDMTDQWCVYSELSGAQGLYDRLISKETTYAAVICAIIESTEIYTTHPKLQHLKRKV